MKLVIGRDSNGVVQHTQVVYEGDVLLTNEQMKVLAIYRDFMEADRSVAAVTQALCAPKVVSVMAELCNREADRLLQIVIDAGVECVSHNCDEDNANTLLGFMSNLSKLHEEGFTKKADEKVVS